MSYLREEQETNLSYDCINRKWRVYSAYKPHIKRIQKIAETIIREEKDKQGNIFAIDAYLPEKAVKMSIPRILSEEQRILSSERLAKLREKSIT